MISFEKYDLNPELKNELSKLNIEFAFQPIFHNDGKTIFAYEALMRPKDMPITELIYKYTTEDKLHVLEIATMFGAADASLQRGFNEPVSINSFPSEAFTLDEVAAFKQFYSKGSGNGIIEILEYPEISAEQWKRKRKDIKRDNLKISIDDYGAGLNSRETVSFYNPDIIKLDRQLISGIDHNEEKQTRAVRLINDFKSSGIKVLAEGVETKEECDWLIANGIDYLQGYYLGMPQ